MGKVKTAILGSEEESELRDRRKREREEKKKREAAAGKTHLPGMKGGARVKSVGASDEEIEKMAKLSEDVEKIEKEGVKASEKSKKAREGKPRTRSKKYQQALLKIEHGKLYPVNDAMQLLRTVTLMKFDGSVEVHINVLEKGLRGMVNLPHGTGKKIRVAIANQETIDSIVAKVEKGMIDFDALIAHPSVMPKLGKIARYLGPKGLMPNPKAGTISPEPEKVAKKMEGGELAWKTEADFPLIHQVIGKLSFTDKQLAENFNAFVKSITPEKIKAITLKSSMSPGIKIQIG